MRYTEITVICDPAESESIQVRLHDLEVDGAVRSSVAIRTHPVKRTVSLVERRDQATPLNSFGPDCKEYCGRKCMCELAMPDAYRRAISGTADAIHSN
jgi:hypothetical protein